MHFTRLIIKNVEVEHLQASPVLIYFVTPKIDGDRVVPEENDHTFAATVIKLLDNGWVEVKPSDGWYLCFPPSRVIILEGILNPSGMVL